MEYPKVVYLEDVLWTDQRPTKEESEAGLYGVRADQSGIKMEVRILNTMEHGLHVALTVCDKDRCLMIREQILVSVTPFCQRAFEEGKRRAVMFADAWLVAVL